jgi:polyhydroxyalkanoate synthesis regulator phasin
MLDDVRKYAQSVAEQMSGLAAGFLEWSAEARASLMHEVRDVVARQVGEMGVATKKDLESLRSRVERLEKKVRSEAAGREKPSPRSRKSPPKPAAKSAGSGRR